ncbi:hypothetical protein OVA24_19950 [Luteolibacter sp. SL250]|uniref:hypothetical protein n=1 Tax=Luteolibacter sp. SL250 TaxID=2995170 RepID=UPI00227148B6|nr:hypothetical protein [Luteolibacter sp. SL250]WAC19502.1 hypothetical protein OVA24_19950 [Luteolibacter sp. SL250]
MIRHPLSVAILSVTALHADVIQLPKFPGEAFASPANAGNLDADAFAEWVDGSIRKMEAAPGKQDQGALAILCTPTSNPGHATLYFGDSRNPGPRHLRIGFKESLPVGSILAKDGGTVSVLKPGATYPGDPADDSQWLPAQRYDNGAPVAAGPEKGNLSLWILPPGTSTRALRFTHNAKTTDTDYRGALSGVVVSPTRFINEAWNATAAASIQSQHAGKVLNGEHDGWGAWETQEKGKAPADAAVISADQPEWITLSWRQPVSLNGLAAIWAGISDAEVQSFQGPADRHPKDASDTDWKPVATYGNLRHSYPAQFWPNLLSFPMEVKTRAIRLRITGAGANLSHANNNGGKRAWLGELMALRNLGGEPLKAAPQMAAETLPKAPIPIRFTLAKPGYVSLVVEKPDGFRVRNLVSETHFPAGENVVWWDGSDDLERDVDAAMHGVFNIPVHFIEPGSYRVRGIVRDQIRPHYEFSVYTTGNPPWNTEDSTGAWLANHSPPQAAAFVPAAQSPTGKPVVYLGCYVTEGPSGLAWVDPADGKKLGGKKWVGGHWTAAPFLARDAGPDAEPGTHVYVGSTWETEKGSGIGELRITALTGKGDKPIVKLQLGKLAEQSPGAGERKEDLLGGIAVHNGIVVAAMRQENKLRFFGVSDGKEARTLSVADPKGIIFDAKGDLLVISGNRLLRFSQGQGEPAIIVGAGLEDPQGITADAKGNILVSDWGGSHQVKVFTADGKATGIIGKAGKPAAGKYDPLHMNHPHGIAVDDRGQVWVTEHDFMPKRVSVWTLDGKLVNAFYGPGKYGGGGALDPVDKSKFYYADEGHGTLEFKLDWQKGSWSLENVLYRRVPDEMKLSFRAGGPEQAVYRDGRRYFTNAYNSSPTGGHGTVFIFAEKDGIARPSAAMGNPIRWDLLESGAFLTRWPEGLNPGSKKEPEAFFIWTDLNDDATAQPEEVTIHKGKSGGLTVMQDLSICVSRLDGKAVQFPVKGFTPSGVPLYDFATSKVLAADVQPPKSSGGDQALAGTDGWSVVTLGIGSFDGLSISGAKDGIAKWSYPSPWPGLHASHRAPRPGAPGQLIGTTRLPGSFFEIKGSEAGPLWALHTNHGRMAVFTQDGIFVANLFEDMRGGKSWKMPVAIRNTDLEGITLGEENFWPTLTHASDGKVYLVDGARSAIVRLDGLESIKRLPASDISVSADDLEKGRAWRSEVELARQKVHGSGIMKVAIRPDKPVVDGDIGEWTSADWVDIDKSGVKAYFNANTKPYDITGAVAVSGDRLYAAWKTGATEPLKNSGETPMAPFKTGDALDLMLGPGGDRKKPVAGDMRLLVTLVDGKPLALLYRAVVPGTKDADKVPFSSPWRTITFDKVEDVSSLIEFSGSGGNYEVSIPLASLGFKPSLGAKIRGDIGVLRGTGGETTARVYWSNKATGIVSDVPDEAMLNPALWGTFEFK